MPVAVGVLELGMYSVPLVGDDAMPGSVRGQVGPVRGTPQPSESP